MGVAKPPSGMVENMPQGQAYQESPGNVPALPANAKPGDWKCACGFHNFARRKECLQCKVAKPSSVADIGFNPTRSRRVPSRATLSLGVGRSANAGGTVAGAVGRKAHRRRPRTTRAVP